MKKTKELIMMHLGLVLLAVGVYFFKIPNGFSTGGVTGIGTILAAITPISAGAWIWTLNFLLMVLGFIFLGKQNAVKTECQNRTNGLHNDRRNTY